MFLRGAMSCTGGKEAHGGGIGLSACRLPSERRRLSEQGALSRAYSERNAVAGWMRAARAAGRRPAIAAAAMIQTGVQARRSHG